jgi:hypothetical protein
VFSGPRAPFLAIVVVTERAYVFARSAFRPSSPPAFFLTFLPPSGGPARHSRRAALSGSARKSGTTRVRKRREAVRKIDRGPQTPAVRRRERRTKDGLARPTRGMRGGIGPRGAATGGKGRARDAKGDAKETTKRSNAKMAPERDTAARNSRQFRAKLLGAGRARTLASRRRAPRAAPPRLFNVISLDQGSSR